LRRQPVCPDFEKQIVPIRKGSGGKEDMRGKAEQSQHAVIRIVFSDLDGTLLTGDKRITPLTREAVRSVQQIGIPFVAASSRSPAGIYPTLEAEGIVGPVISCGGGIILDADRNVIFHRGFSRMDAEAVLASVTQFNRKCRNGRQLTWCLYSYNQWIVESRKDPRVHLEEKLVRADAVEGTLADVEQDEIHKIMCIGEPAEIAAFEQKIKKDLPHLSAARSSAVLLEIMAEGVSKGKAVRTVCGFWNIPVENSLAFGDNYNDVEMLRSAGRAVVMANAPEKMLEEFPEHTLDNEHDGIYYALRKMDFFPRPVF